METHLSLFKPSFYRYNNVMKKSNHSYEKLTNKQKKALRAAQVRKQKIILAAAAVLMFMIVAAHILPSHRPDPIKHINEACESYRADMERIAAGYDMSDYVDLLLALMMQESSGIGPDVMQSSEGAFNTLYPQVPNGITDDEYSIECGIQELKYALDKAHVQGPSDLKRIRIALQAYNFGADVYFSYMEEHNETSWSEESAEAFAQMASGGRERTEDDPFRDTAGPWDYGDQKYPEHVLQYYHPEEAA